MFAVWTCCDGSDLFYECTARASSKVFLGGPLMLQISLHPLPVMDPAKFSVFRKVDAFTVMITWRGCRCRELVWGSERPSFSVSSFPSGLGAVIAW